LECLNSASFIAECASSALTRGMMFSGFFSSSGFASQPSWKSMRQTLSGCGATARSGSGGTAGRTRTSARPGLDIHPDVGDQEAVAECPATASWPISWRTAERPPSHAAT
jgi:hypothetical protein